jgi:hypothetical protein
VSLRPINAELYRCYYFCDDGSSLKLDASLDPRRLVPWVHVLANERGRWDDPLDKYRVLYTADSEVTAFIEVLVDLRPSIKTIHGLAAIDDADDGLSEEDLAEEARLKSQRAAQARLQLRYMALLTISTEHLLCDVMHGVARSELEQYLRFAPNTLKTGDFSIVNTKLTQSVSRFIYAKEVVGIYGASSEAGNGYVVSLFETGENTGVLRAAPTQVAWAEQALRREQAINQAQRYLGI